MSDVTISFGPASTSILEKFGETFGKIPPVLLRDADSITDPSPVIRPSSGEIPDPAERSARLQLFGEIARGGMGAVLKGRDSDLGRDLAVKVLLESHREKPDMVHRFIEEAQIAGQLQHPGIVPIYELGAFGDHRPYFAMKLVKGHTLAEILAARKGLTDGLPRFLAIFESICQTMAYAHARGVIHRDLKPSNVMVGSFGEVQVMDWGLAKVLPRGGAVDDASAGHAKDPETIVATARSSSDSDLSQAGSVMGTPSYMAPEQARGEIDQVDERADVFALGSIFCEILTGTPAFTGRNSGEIQRKAARGDLTGVFAKLDQDELGHDPELIALAKSCLAPAPGDRPRNAGEVAGRISMYHSQVQERLRRAEVARAEEKARAEEAVKRAKVERDRRRLTMALSASVLGMIITVVGGLSYLNSQKLARQWDTEKAVRTHLDLAMILRGQAQAAPVGELAKWDEAINSARRAKSAVDAGVPEMGLRNQVVGLMETIEKERVDASRRAAELNKDREILDQLEAIRSEDIERKENEFEKFDLAYAKAFRELGIDLETLDPSEAGRLLKLRSNPQEFAAHLDDWTFLRKASSEDEDKSKWEGPARIALAADDDPWRARLRGLIGKKSHETVRQIVENEKELEKQDARSLSLLVQVLEDSRDTSNNKVTYLKKSIEILKRGWRLKPDDYQICRALAAESDNELDRVRFSTAAIVAKPESPYRRLGLANALLQGFEFPSTEGLTFGIGYMLTNSEQFKKNYAPPTIGLMYDNSKRNRNSGIKDYNPTTCPQSNLDDSLDELRVATRLAPSSTSFRLDLAAVLFLHGKQDEGRRESEIIRRMNPTLKQGSSLGRCLYQYDQLDLAVEVILNDIQNSKIQSDSFILLGIIYQRQERTRLAFEAFRKAFLGNEVPLEDNIPTIGLDATGTPEEVLEVIKEAAIAHPKQAELHHEIAVRLKALGRIDESNAAYDRQIMVLLEQNHEKEDARALLELGSVYLDRGQADMAIDNLQRVLELGLDQPSSYNNIAWKIAVDNRTKAKLAKTAVEFALKACESSK